MFKKFLTNDEVSIAEIIWCLTTMFKHFSNRGATEAVTIFLYMFSDSEIAAKMKLQRDRMGYTITYGIAYQFQKDLINSVATCEHLVVGFDESLNKISQKQQMDLIDVFGIDFPMKSQQGTFLLYSLTARFQLN